MKPQFPTVQEQIAYWNTKERLEHERVMDIRYESRDATNETRKVNLRDKAQSVLNWLACDVQIRGGYSLYAEQLFTDLQKSIDATRQ